MYLTAINIAIHVCNKATHIKVDLHFRQILFLSYILMFPSACKKKALSM